MIKDRLNFKAAGAIKIDIKDSGPGIFWIIKFLNHI
jgi:hypothetical protein